jgi:hypothetical protein
MRIGFGADDDNACVRAVVEALAGHDVTRVETATWPATRPDFARRAGVAVATGALSLKRLAPDVAVECVRAFPAEPSPTRTRPRTSRRSRVDRGPTVS